MARGMGRVEKSRLADGWCCLCKVCSFSVVLWVLAVLTRSLYSICLCVIDNEACVTTIACNVFSWWQWKPLETQHRQGCGFETWNESDRMAVPAVIRLETSTHRCVAFKKKTMREGVTVTRWVEWSRSSVYAARVSLCTYTEMDMIWSL